jgi:putative membrane protein
MNAHQTTSEHNVKPSVLPQVGSHFSWLRTRLSIERTLMSWVRTAAAFIGFGFTIFQFFERFNQMSSVAPPVSPITPRIVSLALIAIGTFALFVAIGEYRKVVNYLWSDEFKDIAGMEERAGWTPIGLVAIMLAIVGIGVFGTLLLRTIS